MSRSLWTTVYVYEQAQQLLAELQQKRYQHLHLQRAESTWWSAMFDSYCTQEYSDFVVNYTQKFSGVHWRRRPSVNSGRSTDTVVVQGPWSDDCKREVATSWSLIT